VKNAVKYIALTTHCSAMKTNPTPSPDALLAFDALARKGSLLPPPMTLAVPKAASASW
jgi:hypothetical protein